MIFFASSSGVENFISKWGLKALNKKTVIVIGKPTAQALQEKDYTSYIVAKEATVQSAIKSLAAYNIANTLYRLSQ